MCSQPALSIYRADDAPSAPRSDEPTLSEIFESRVLPTLLEQQRSPTTIRDYRLHLERWRQYWRSPSPNDLGSTRIIHPRALAPGEPAAADVTEEDLLGFRRWLPEVLGADASARNRNKHLATLQTILRAAGRHVAPRPLEQARAADKLYLSREEVSALYDAADAAGWPAPVGALSAGDWWRVALVLWWHYGFRTQELTPYEADHEPLRVRQIRWQEETPHPSGRAVCEFGWLVYTPQKQRRLKPEPLVLPLSRVAHAHVRLALRGRSGRPDEPLLPLPRCNRSFYAAWSRIVRAARVRPKPALDGAPRDYEPGHFRKTCSTWLNVHRPGIAEFITGHSKRNQDEASAVNKIHYDNQELRVLEALQTFPQPAAFDSIFDRSAKQLRLF